MASVNYGPKLPGPALLLGPQEIDTQHFKVFVWPLMDRTDVEFEVPYVPLFKLNLRIKDLL